MDPLVVQAVYEYSPVNNDELRLSVGDKIIVTQAEDGGWWEGTLNGKTAWFPSNYVQIIEAENHGSSDHTSMGSKELINGMEVDSNFAKFKEHRDTVLNEIVDSEDKFLLELEMFITQYLKPLHGAAVASNLTELIESLTRIVTTHRSYLLKPLIAERSKASDNRRIGKIFLDSAPKLEPIIVDYCFDHPSIIQSLECSKEKINRWLESRGGQVKTMMQFIVKLSLPFRRFENYTSVLKELERHMEESHFDRGNVQRSILHYENLEKRCTEKRKKKEMQLEVLKETIKDLEGPELSTLGPVVEIDLVRFGKSADDMEPRYFILFSNLLVILSHDLKENATQLTFKGSITVSGIIVKPLPDCANLKNAFEICGPLLDSKIVQCPTKESKEAWINHLRNIIRSSHPTSNSFSEQRFSEVSTHTQAWDISRLHPAPPYNPFIRQNLRDQDYSSSIGMDGKYDIYSDHDYAEVTNEDYTPVLDLIDSFSTLRQSTTGKSNNAKNVQNNTRTFIM